MGKPLLNHQNWPENEVTQPLFTPDAAAGCSGTMSIKCSPMKAFSAYSQVWKWDLAPRIPALITHRDCPQPVSNAVKLRCLAAISQGMASCHAPHRHCHALPWDFSLRESLPLGPASLHRALRTASQTPFPQHIVSHPVIFMALFDFHGQYVF